MKTYTFDVDYPASLYFKEDIDDPKHPDRIIEKIVKRYGSSGLGFGRRDMSFYFNIKKAAINARKRLMRSKKVKGLQVYELQEIDEHGDPITN